MLGFEAVTHIRAGCGLLFPEAARHPFPSGARGRRGWGCPVEARSSAESGGGMLRFRTGGDNGHPGEQTRSGPTPPELCAGCGDVKRSVRSFVSESL